MKIRLVILIVISAVYLNVNGQAIIKSKNVMAPKQISGINAVTGSYYLSSYGSGGAISYSKFFKKKISLRLGASFNQGLVEHTEYSRYLLEIDGIKNVFNFKDILFLNVGLVTGFGNENRAYEYSNNSQEGFLYELGVSAGIEIYIFPMFSAEFGIRQIALGNTELGRRYFYLPISLKHYY